MSFSTSLSFGFILYLTLKFLQAYEQEIGFLPLPLFEYLLEVAICITGKEEIIS